MPLTSIGICSIGPDSSGATSQHVDARVPIFQMAGWYCEALHSMALNIIVLPSVFIRYVWWCYEHHCYPSLPPFDCFCGRWVIWRSMAMQTWSQRWYLEIGLALNCSHSRLHWWEGDHFNSTNVCWVLGPTACTRRLHQLSENGWRTPRRLFANIHKMAEPECGKLSCKVAQDWIVEFQQFTSISS